MHPRSAAGEVEQCRTSRGTDAGAGRAVPVCFLVELGEAGIELVVDGPVHRERTELAFDADHVFLHDHVFIADLAASCDAEAGRIFVAAGRDADRMRLRERRADAGVTADVET